MNALTSKHFLSRVWASDVDRSELTLQNGSLALLFCVVGTSLLTSVLFTNSGRSRHPPRCDSDRDPDRVGDPEIIIRNIIKAIILHNFNYIIEIVYGHVYPIRYGVRAKK